MGKSSLFILVLLFVWLISCKRTVESKVKESNQVDSVSLLIKNADSLLALVNIEWNEYLKLDSAKYKDIKGIYFQLKNANVVDKKMSLLETQTLSLEKRNLKFDTLSFVNDFFVYDSLLMVHSMEVMDYAVHQKEAEKLALLNQYCTSLKEEVSDVVFVKFQSHLFNAIEIYNNYLRKHPIITEKATKHKLLPQNQQFLGSEANS